MTHTEVLFGNMEHGEFAKDKDTFPIVIIHSIEERGIMNPADADEYMVSQGYDSYVIPSEFKGEILYSSRFFNSLCNQGESK